jgi:hypothetical protein
MSHTTTIKSVAIKDVAALHSAIAELNSKYNRNITLKENQVPRMYYESQSAEVGNCPYVIDLGNKSRYDVGLKYDENNNLYPIMDIHGGDIRSQLGTSCKEGSDSERAIGELMQLYTKHAAINSATSQGYIVEQITTLEDGRIELTVGVNSGNLY